MNSAADEKNHVAAAHKQPGQLVSGTADKPRKILRGRGPEELGKHTCVSHIPSGTIQLVQSPEVPRPPQVDMRLKSGAEMGYDTYSRYLSTLGLRDFESTGT